MKRPHDYDDLEAWRISRPRHQPPHERFFEDGEEPPARYDLPNQADYIEVNLEPIRTSRWFRVATCVARRGIFTAVGHTFGYYSMCTITYCFAGPILHLSVAPAYHADITQHWIARLTGQSPGFKPPACASGKTLRFALGNLPVQLTAVLAIVGILYCIGGAIECVREMRFRRENGLVESSLANLGLLLSVAGVIAVLLLHAFVAVRICGFVPHLIIDYDLDAVDSFSANWRITRGRTWQLMRLKFALWIIKYPIGFESLGLGLLLFEPYSVAVWTAAYLDIAGSEPIMEDFDRSVTMTREKK